MSMGQRKMSQVLGASGLLDFTMLQSVLAWRAFETYEPFVFLIFNFFKPPLNADKSNHGY
jgi:hypothetical protein